MTGPGSDCTSRQNTLQNTQVAGLANSCMCNRPTAAEPAALDII